MAFIYKITCTKNNKLYVGSTVRLLCQRWGDHRSALRKKYHANIHLQRAWDKYGEDSFIFEKIEECSKDIRQMREQYWIDYYDVFKNGFNRNPIAGTSVGIKRSKETCAKISASKNWKKAVAVWTGSKHTEDTRKVIRDKRSLQVMEAWSDERRLRASIRQKEASKSAKYDKTSSCIYFNIIAYNNEETLYFANTHDAKLKLNLKHTGYITRVLKGERTFFNGYKWTAQIKSDKLLENQVIDNQQPI